METDVLGAIKGFHLSLHSESINIVLPISLMLKHSHCLLTSELAIDSCRRHLLFQQYKVCVFVIFQSIERTRAVCLNPLT